MSFSVNSTEKAFSDYLKGLIEKDKSRVLVAFSGGCDSLALLVLCKKALGAENVVPCYVNHRIRCNEELAGEIEVNKNNCRKLGLNLIVKDLGEGSVLNLAKSRKGGTEDAARVLRYKVLEESRQEYNCDWIATAHHKDDQIETVVMRLLRNSPEVSLKGILPVNGNIIRPLLNFYKEELSSYLKAEGYEWSTDSTNSDNSIYRNKIRNEILPVLRAANKDFDSVILEKSNSLAGKILSFDFKISSCLDYSWFCSLDNLQKNIVLFACWDEYVGGILPQTLISRVTEADRDCVISANGGTFCIYNSKLYVLKNDDSEFENFSCALEERTIPGNMKIEIADEGDGLTLFLEKKDLSLPFEVRFAHQGDRIALKDGSKMVLRLLQDNKVPSVLRKRVPVLVLGNEVVAVFSSVYGGRDRIAQRFRTSLAPLRYCKYISIKRY